MGRTSQAIFAASGSLVDTAIPINLVATLLQTGPQGQPGTPAASGNRVLLTSQTVSTPVSQVFFAYTFTNLYDIYEFDIYGLLPDTNSVNLYGRCSLDGSTVDSSTNYQVGQVYGTSGNTGGSGGSAGNAQMIFASGLGNTATYNNYMKLTMVQPWATDRWKYFLAEFGGQWTVGVTALLGSNIYINTGQLRGISFFPSSGNITRGTFRLYGIQI